MKKRKKWKREKRLNNWTISSSAKTNSGSLSGWNSGSSSTISWKLSSITFDSSRCWSCGGSKTLVSSPESSTTMLSSSTPLSSSDSINGCWTVEEEAQAWFLVTVSTSGRRVGSSLGIFRLSAWLKSE
jgi:hypothetical protein